MSINESYKIVNVDPIIIDPVQELIENNKRYRKLPVINPIDQQTDRGIDILMPDGNIPPGYNPEVIPGNIQSIEFELPEISIPQVEITEDDLLPIQPTKPVVKKLIKRPSVKKPESVKKQPVITVIKQKQKPTPKKQVKRSFMQDLIIRAKRRQDEIRRQARFKNHIWGSSGGGHFQGGGSNGRW